MFRLCLLLCLFTLLAGLSAAGRGPIVRNPDVTAKSSSLEIRWTTDTPGNSQVKLNGQVFSDDALTTRHLVVVPGLQPDTEYHFFVTSSDGAVTSHYNDIVRTKARNATLVARYGADFVQALQASFGAVDEEKPSPQVARVLAIHELLSVRRGLAELERQLKACREAAARMQEVQAWLTAGAPAQDLPKDAAEVINEITALIPDIASGDLASMLLVESNRMIQRLKTTEKDCQARQAELKGAEARLVKSLAARN